jgi:hypothetical protein
MENDADNSYTQQFCVKYSSYMTSDFQLVAIKSEIPMHDRRPGTHTLYE